MYELDSRRMIPDPAEDPSWMDLPDPTKALGGFDLGAALEEDLPSALENGGEVVFEKAGSMEDIIRELQENGYSPMVFPNFNYELGVACFTASLFDEAIEQFRIALQTEQNPMESIRYLALCYREKGLFEEALRYSDSMEEPLSLPDRADAAKGERDEIGLQSSSIESEEGEIFAIDTLSLADLEIQKRLAPYRDCLKFPQGPFG